ncbi:MAG: hypothetical protein ACTH31_02695 [Pseudoclavibacter sp.]
MWQYAYVETITGRERAVAHVTESSWARRVSAGSSADFILDVSGLSRGEVRDLTEPWTNSIVQTFHGAAVTLTPIVRRSRVGEHAVQVTCLDAFEITSRRLPHGIWGYGLQPFRIYDLDEPSTIYHALTRAFESDSDPRWALPFQESYVESGSVRLDVWNHELRTVDRIVNDQIAKSDAVWLELYPTRLPDRSLAWTPRLGRDSPSEQSFVAPADPDFVDVQWTEDASEQLTGVIVAGEGSDEDMLVGIAGQRSTNPYRGPHLDRVFFKKNLAKQSDLDAYAAQMRNTYERPTFEVQLTLRANRLWPTQMLMDVLNLAITDDPMIDPAPRRYRVVGMTGDHTDIYKLELQEV